MNHPDYIEVQAYMDGVVGLGKPHDVYLLRVFYFYLVVR